MRPFDRRSVRLDLKTGYFTCKTRAMVIHFRDGEYQVFLLGILHKERGKEIGLTLRNDDYLQPPPALRILAGELAIQRCLAS
jgi:hypothetical protein